MKLCNKTHQPIVYEEIHDGFEMNCPLCERDARKEKLERDCKEYKEDIEFYKRVLYKSGGDVK